MAMTAPSPFVERWRRFWFDEIPPHSYALIRILIGVVGAMTIIGAWNPAFWQVDGIMPPAAASHSWPWLTAHGLGDIVGLSLRWTLLAGFVALALGVQTQIVALGIFLGSAGMIWWNPAPFSGGQQLLHNITFPLVFVDSGAVWSVDAFRRARRGEIQPRPEPIWPLRLWQYQLAMLYLAAGLWKMANPDWRSGFALHYVLNNLVYQRIPGEVPHALFWPTVFLTYLTLAWELAFPVLIWFRRTRPAMLLIGLALHLGMWVTMEVGAFMPTVLIAYVAFLDPWRTEPRVRRLFSFRRAQTAIPVSTAP